MHASLPHVRLGRDPTPALGELPAPIVTLAALRVGDLLAHDELSCAQLARRLDVHPDRLSALLAEAEALGLVRRRAGRYTLTRAGACLRSGPGPLAARPRRTARVGGG